MKKIDSIINRIINQNIQFNLKVNPLIKISKEDEIKTINLKQTFIFYSKTFQKKGFLLDDQNEYHPLRNNSSVVLRDPSYKNGSFEAPLLLFVLFA